MVHRPVSVTGAVRGRTVGGSRPVADATEGRPVPSFARTSIRIQGISLTAARQFQLSDQ